MESLLSWLESRTCGINQRVLGSSPRGGAEKTATYEEIVGGWFFYGQTKEQTFEEIISESLLHNIAQHS